MTVVLTLFLVLFLRTTRIASRSNDAFSGLVAFGQRLLLVVLDELAGLIDVFAAAAHVR